MSLPWLLEAQNSAPHSPPVVLCGEHVIALALVGIELKDKADLEPLLRRMEQIPLNFRPLGSEDLLYDYIV